MSSAAKPKPARGSLTFLFLTPEARDELARIGQSDALRATTRKARRGRALPDPVPPAGHNGPEIVRIDGRNVSARWLRAQGRPVPEFYRSRNSA